MAGSDYETLLEHWNTTFRLTREEMKQSGYEPEKDTWQQLAPSHKMARAIESLKDCENVLDYGSGSGWASMMMVGYGCSHVTCADPTPNGREMAEYYAELYGFSDRITTVTIDETWLSQVPDKSYDGFFCSNVLDVIPPQMAGEIIANAARVVTDDARIIIGLNFYMSPEKAGERGMKCCNGNMFYLDGVLRMVSYTDEEWIQMLGEYFEIEHLEHFGWEGEEKETRRLFYLKPKKKKTA